MKNALILLAFCILCTYSAAAQFGIKGGLNFSSIAADADEIDEKNTTVGYQAGLMLRFPVSDWIDLQPELLYIRKGARYEAGPLAAESKFHYVEAPVMLLLSPFNGPLNVHAGPVFSHLVSVKYEYSNANTNPVLTVDDDLDNYNTWDVGLGVGAGLKLGNVLLEVRYNRGFRDINKSNDVEFQPQELRNYNVQAAAGVYF